MGSKSWNPKIHRNPHNVLIIFPIEIATFGVFKHPRLHVHGRLTPCHRQHRILEMGTKIIDDICHQWYNLKKKTHNSHRIDDMMIMQ